MSAGSERDARMLIVDPRAGAVTEARVSALPTLLRTGDVVVVNDAATFPASLRGRTSRGESIEARLLDAPFSRRTRAVLFGAGDHRIPTEHRPPPPPVAPGDALELGGVRLEVTGISLLSPRLVELDWPLPREARFRALYAFGKPVQYSYMPDELALWDVQTAFATRPVAVEMPSAAWPLRWDTLLALRKAGVEIAALTHAAGLSATGDPAIDDALPLPETYVIPERTAARVRGASAEGRRVIAVGTSVVRALEDSAARHGQVVPGEALAELVLDAETPLRATSGLFTGIHMPGESHHRLLRSFVDAETLARAVAIAREKRYRMHEHGDACLVLSGEDEALPATA